MIEFKPVALADKPLFDKYLPYTSHLGCEYSFTNIYLWGKQRYALVHDHIVLFSQFDDLYVYPYPIGCDDKKPVLDAIITDSKERGVPCSITCLQEAEKQLLNELYPDKFNFYFDRDSYDYVYSIDDLADLKGKKFQKKRNHLNRFKQNYPDYFIEPLSDDNIPKIKPMLEEWYQSKSKNTSDADFQMEKDALKKVFDNYRELNAAGILLYVDGKVAAFTLASQLSDDTLDVHFEKALPTVDNAYAAINSEFAKYIRSKYPNIKFLNREDDVGALGLRKSKLSYNPHHLVEKSWACPAEAENENQ